VASSLPELVAFRVLQGAGGGMLAPVGTAMLYRTFPPQQRVRAASVIIVPTALAPAIVPVMGGLLVTDVSWRWVFYVNVPIGIAALAFGGLFVRQTAETSPGAFDWRGFALSAAGLGQFMYGISEGPGLGWDSPAILTTIAAGAALLGAMIATELRARQPVIALRLLSSRLFRSATWAIMMASIALLRGDLRRHPLPPGRARPQRAERRPEPVPQRDRHHRRIPAGQPRHLLAPGTAPARHDRAMRRLCIRRAAVPCWDPAPACGGRG
jgi:MFS family permease